MQGLEELMASGQIGPRSLIRNVETGAEAYLDQLAGFSFRAPAVHAEPTSLKTPTVRTVSVIAGIAGFLIVGMVVATVISSQAKVRAAKEFRQRLAAKMQAAAPQIRAAIKGHNNFFPRYSASQNLAGIDPLGGAALTVPNTSEAVRIDWNYNLPGKKIDFTKNAKTWVITAIPAGSDDKYAVMTIDGTVYEVSSFDYYDVVAPNGPGKLDTSKLKQISPP